MGSTTRSATMCGYCKRRKRIYYRRGDAKKAMRILYPGSVGEKMMVYVCRSSPAIRFHLGHRKYAPESPIAWPTWTESTVEQSCQECSGTIHEGDALAWSCALALCLDCGSDVELQVIGQ